MFSPVSWWKRDSARNTYYFLLFLHGWVFTMFGTYGTGQLQMTGVAIGTDTTGRPCTSECTVLMGTQPLTLESILLYLTAMTLGLGGFLLLNLTFFADFWRNKSLLVTGCTAIYGVFTIPVYWLTAPTETNFNSLFALTAVFNIMGTVFMFIIQVYIPHCMRVAGYKHSDSFVSQGSPSISSAATTTEERRNYGFAMAVLGIAFDSGSATLATVLVTVFANKASPTTAQNNGLLLTTISGFLILVGVVGCFIGLPKLAARKWSGMVYEIGHPVIALLTRKNTLSLVVSYTIYTGVVFALYSNIFQVYLTEAMPNALETSMYTLSSTLFSWAAYVVYFFVQRKFRFNLEKCLLFGYATTLIVVVWGMVGMSNQNNFGEKRDWEFWIVMVIYQVTGSIVNSTWRVLYSELIPAGEEYLWFGMQGVLYCATTWLNSVATTPLQTSTNNMRFPLVLCLIFGLIPVVLETVRMILPTFKADLTHWQNNDEQDALREGESKDMLETKKTAQSKEGEIA